MRQVGIPFGKHKHVVVEDLQVLRYEVDQHYHTHHDYFDPKMHHGFLQVPCLILVRISYLPGGVMYFRRRAAPWPARPRFRCFKVWV